MDPDEFEVGTWDVINSYFGNNKGYQLVKHQLESYNDFILRKLDHIIDGFNPIEILHQFVPDAGAFKYTLVVKIVNPVLNKPIIYEKDGSTKTMTPNDARLRNFTYSSNLTVDLEIKAKTLTDDNLFIEDTKTLKSVLLGKIPIMVKSNYCILNNKSSLLNNNECKYDYGGYFIVNGNEKVIISQDRISENKTYVFVNNKVSTYSHVAEIRSVQENKLGVPKITTLKLSAKANQFGRFIRVNIHHIKNDIPLFVLFKALGLANDKEIITYIVYDIENHLNSAIVNELIGSIEEANNIQCPKDALEYLSKYLNITGYPKEILNNKVERINIVRKVLSTEFLPHVGEEFPNKALYLAYMVNKLLKCVLGLKSFDDRDSYINKKIDTPGVLMANLFRQYYGKVVKDMKNMIQKEINVGGWKATNKFLNVINKVNIYKIVKSTIIDSGMRYALATGNWGIKNNKNKQGVAQVLNRMTYSATISHMRRINTPIEKSGKLVQPRKLHSTQWGIVCPSECFDPETPILMWDGLIKKAKDIIVGDYLIDDNGNAVKVKSTCSGYKTMYEIVPDKKNFMRHTVTDNHILTLQVRKYKNVRDHRGKKELSWFDKKELRFRYKEFDNDLDLGLFKSSIDDDNVIDVTIEKYLSLPQGVRKSLYIFKSDGINWDHKDVALDPYILGMWLGDGLSCGYGFVTADQELLDKWIEWGKDNDATIKHGIKYQYTISSTINNTQGGIACNRTEPAPLKKLLKVYNLVKNKHIPLEYLTNDRKTRLAVLAGLVDTDGNVRANGHEIRIPQGEKNYKIIDDAEFLARSLGFSCHVNSGMCTYSVNGEKRQKPYKELYITGAKLYEIPTVLPRKKLNKFENPISEKRCASFMQSSFKLVKKDVQPFVGWQLEGNGRFLLGDMSVSHNTPEGSSVGLVKNMSIISSVTISSNSNNIRGLILDYGVEMFDGTNISIFNNNTKVIINGDIIGVHRDPATLYQNLKKEKLAGTINIYTGIVWNIKDNEIIICTEGGRAVRPLYIVNENNQMALTSDIVQQIRAGKVGWKDLLINHKIIEFLDVEEANTMMIAMKPKDLIKGQKGSLHTLKYTHLEIHPSLILGVLASTIPFSDHNQAPRNCLNAEDHEILTIHGFLGLNEILERTADGKQLAIACHVDGKLEYHNISRDRVVYQDDYGEPLTATEFVSFESKTVPCERNIPGKPVVSAPTSKGVSLLVTTNHIMYGRLGFADKLGVSSYRWPQKMMPDRYRSVPPEYKTYEAGEVVKFADQDPPAARGAAKVPVFQLQCNFTNGITPSAKANLPFVEVLGLATDDQIDAFLWLYGYWLGDGWLEGARGYIAFGPKKKKDVAKLTEIFNRLPLPLLKYRDYGVHGYWKASGFDSKGQWNFSICSIRWWNYFAQQYGHKYDGKYAEEAYMEGAARRNSSVPRTRVQVKDNIYPEPSVSSSRSSSPQPPDAEDIKSAKWFWSWVYDSLDASKLKIVLSGLRFADGNEAAGSTQGGTIHTSSVRFRDEIERVCIMAGYTVSIRRGTAAPGQDRGTNAHGHKIIARHQAWNVDYTTSSVSATPYLEIGEEIKLVKMEKPTRVFCVEVPTESHLIMVRRKIDDQMSSRPTIISNCYQSAQAKQAIGVYTSNFRQRYDTLGHVLQYPQRPIIKTKMASILNTDNMPNGINAIVAIACYTGLNQEDGFILNKSAVDRGMFVSTYYQTYKEQNNKNHSNGEEEFFTKPEVKSMKAYNYDKLQKDGFVPENTYIEGGDIIIGKCMPNKIGSVINYKDNSIVFKGSDRGFIDKNAHSDKYFCNVNGDGYTFAKVRIRADRIPVIGDKLSSRSGQKGTCGMLYRQEDMPFTKDGIVPDLIMNPHAIPSRMTIGQLIECIMGKACLDLGTYGDSTPFTDLTVEEIADVLESCGMERYGNEIMYNSRTGQQIDTLIFMGPTYYQRLKHMTCDKVHCLLSDHDVLTLNKGWVPIPEITKDDLVATLKDGKLVYEKPLKVLHYPNYKGKMYHISNSSIDLDVTVNHRMYVSKPRNHKWLDYELVKAEEIVGKHVKYKKDAEWEADDYQFVLPSYQDKPEIVVNMDDWLTFFGIWMAEGWTTKPSKYAVEIAANKKRVKDVLFDALSNMGFEYTLAQDEKLHVYNKQLHSYMAPLSVGAPNKSLPDWVWKLSSDQCKKLIHNMCLGDGSFAKNGRAMYYTSSDKLADDFSKLCLHAGWSSTKGLHIPANSTGRFIKGREIVNNHAIWRLPVIKSKNTPAVNHTHVHEQEVQKEKIYDYEGPVYCLQVPSEVFYVRRNGKSCWTGNSRANNGPVVLLSRQPSEGRAKSGGLRCGEMEIECMWSSGMFQFLKERIMECSDNYRFFVCKDCGLPAIVNPEKGLYLCKNCKNNTNFSEIRAPYAFKLLIQEIQTMNVCTRFLTEK